jgi:hypothetical protein
LIIESRRWRTSCENSEIQNATHNSSGQQASLKADPNSSRSKDCYSLPVIPHNTYQIRATFCYGVYDNQYLTSPSFDLAIDGTIVDSIFIGDPFNFQYKEYWVLSQNNVISLCLSRDSSTTNPFISAISLVPRSLGPLFSVSDLYFIGLYYRTQFRWNFGGSSFLRYLTP